ncbi:MAG: cysteine-rich CWC family protein [Burkholderiaceae bacterium]|nr:cysteine-rich CWC family protein [Burkholderiaceae bacterium]
MTTGPPFEQHAAGDFASRCCRCGATFHCGVDEPGGCWCARLPLLPATALEAGVGCVCPACLDALLREVRQVVA